MAPVMEVVSAHPRVALNVTVDDIQITAVGSSDNVVGGLVDVAGDMLDVIDCDLHCVVKRAKAATVSSDRAVAGRLRAAL